MVEHKNRNALRRLLVSFTLAFGIFAGILEPENADAGPAYIDLRSRGGDCDDSRAQAAARSAATPWCTLAAAARRARPGSTVLVRGGSYPGGAVEGVNARRPVTFKPYPDESPVLRGLRVTRSSGLRFERLRITDQTVLDNVSRVSISNSDISPHGIQIDSSHHLRFENNVIHDLTMRIDRASGRCVPPRCGYGFRITASHDLRIADNVFRRIPGDGIQSGMGRRIVIEGNEFTQIRPFVDPAEHSDAIQFYGGSARLTIRGNHFHDTRGPLIGDPYIGQKNRGLVVENNLIVDQTDWGLKVYDAPRMKLVNNTVWDARLGVVLAGNSSRRVRAFNNVLERLRAPRGSFALEDYNLIGGGYRRGRHDLALQPRFADRAAGDYGLLGSSPGIDAGMSRGAPRRDRRGRTRTDIAGIANTGAGRRYFDLGAEEFTGPYRPPASSYAAEIASEPGLLAHWRLGETGGRAVLDRIGAIAGELTGAIGLGAPGAIAGDRDTSMRFAGGRIAIPSRTSLASRDFTLEGWTHLDRGAGGNNALYGAAGSLRLLVRPTGIYAGVWLDGRERVLQAETPRNAGRWVHWALVRDGDRLRIYRDGYEIAAGKVPAAGSVNLAGTIGAVGATTPARALIDEVALYRAPLGAAAIGDHASFGS